MKGMARANFFSQFVKNLVPSIRKCSVFTLHLETQTPSWPVQETTHTHTLQDASTFSITYHIPVVYLYVHVYPCTIEWMNIYMCTWVLWAAFWKCECVCKYSLWHDTGAWVNSALRCLCMCESVRAGVPGTSLYLLPFTVGVSHVCLFICTLPPPREPARCWRQRCPGVSRLR